MAFKRSLGPVARTGRLNRKPPRPTALPLKTDARLIPEFVQQTLHRPLGQVRQNLSEIGKRAALGAIVLDMTKKQRLVRLAIESSAPSVDATLPDMCIQGSREEKGLPHPFDRSQLREAGSMGLQRVWQGLATVDVIQGGAPLRSPRSFPTPGAREGPRS